MSSTAALQSAVRDALKAQGRLAVDAMTLDPAANLYEAGMTSHCSVNVMLTLEGRFDLEFPDHMLTRDTFASIENIANALQAIGAQA